jgi:hypothetical protein
MARFDVTRALVAACLKAGQPVIVETSGKRGTITVRAEAKLSYSVWINGQDTRLACYTDASYTGAAERDAAEHFIALTGERRALQAAKRSALRPIHSVEADLAWANPSSTGGPREAVLLSYTCLRFNGSPRARWGYIARGYAPGRGKADLATYGSLLGVDVDVAEDSWAELCEARGTTLALSCLAVAKLSRGVAS